MKKIILIILILSHVFTTPLWANHYTKPNILYSAHEKDVIYSLQNLENILGSKITKWVSNNKYYPYILNQKYTGAYSQTNCGATVVSIVERYTMDKQTLAVSEIRKKEYGVDSGWYVNNLTNALKMLSIKYQSRIAINEASFRQNIIKAVEKEGVVIVGIRLNRLHKADESSMLGRAYGIDGWDGHFILIKGYVQTENGDVYYEIYDPNRIHLYTPNTYYECKNLYDSLLFTEYIIVPKHQWLDIE